MRFGGLVVEFGSKLKLAVISTPSRFGINLVQVNLCSSGAARTISPAAARQHTDPHTPSVVSDSATVLASPQSPPKRLAEHRHPVRSSDEQLVNPPASLALCCSGPGFQTPCLASRRASALVGVQKLDDEVVAVADCAAVACEGTDESFGDRVEIADGRLGSGRAGGVRGGEPGFEL